MSGKTFVISGLLESLTREEATDLTRRLRQTCYESVNGEASSLFVGKEVANRNVIKRDPKNDVKDIET